MPARASSQAGSPVWPAQTAIAARARYSFNRSEVRSAQAPNGVNDRVDRATSPSEQSMINESCIRIAPMITAGSGPNAIIAAAPNAITRLIKVRAFGVSPIRTDSRLSRREIRRSTKVDQTPSPPRDARRQAMSDSSSDSTRLSRSVVTGPRSPR